jgi:hypothetical protein
MQTSCTLADPTDSPYSCRFNEHRPRDRIPPSPAPSVGKGHFPHEITGLLDLAEVFVELNRWREHPHFIAR